MALNDVFVRSCARCSGDRRFPPAAGGLLVPDRRGQHPQAVRGPRASRDDGRLSYLRQFTYTKFVIVTDDDIDVRDWAQVIWAVSTRVDPARDSLLVENTPVDYLDFSSPVPNLGSKLGWTPPINGRGKRRAPGAVRSRSTRMSSDAWTGLWKTVFEP